MSSSRITSTPSHHLNQMNLSIFKLPNPINLIEMNSRPHNNFVQYYHLKNKQNVAMYSLQLERDKLLYNLELYQWRNHTEFPIVKTKFVELNQGCQLSGLVNLKIYLQYCPIKLSHLYDLNIGQAIYLLKQSVIGFQRLFNRFGAFKINNSMIYISEKGHCKVWIHENPSINQIAQKTMKQEDMVQKVIQLLETHSNQSKSCKKIFTALHQCQTFYQVLVKIQKLTKLFRILVPNKIIFRTDHKEYPQNLAKFIYRHRQTTKHNRFYPLIRMSIRSTKTHKKNLSKTKDHRINQNKPNKIKRFKSQDQIRQNSALKTSQGQTSHSRNIKSSNIGLLYHSPRDTGYEYSQLSDHSARKRYRTKWVEEPSFIIGTLQSKAQTKQQFSIYPKKQLSHSQAFKSMRRKQRNHSNQRKFSGSYKKQNLPLPQKNLCSTKENPNNISVSKYEQEFKEILNDEDIMVTPKRSNCSVYEEDEKMREHAQKVVVNNGWQLTTDLLMSVPREMQSSFVSGQEQSCVNQHQNLCKLGRLGRRQIVMSLLPEDENFL